jgi:GAF domain-containing protein
MRRRIAVYGISEDALQILPALAEGADIELVAVFDPHARAHRRRLALMDPHLAEVLGRALTDDPKALLVEPPLDAVVDAGIAPPFRVRFPDLVGAGVEVFSPLTARLLWGLGLAGPDPKRELLQALEEIAESVDLVADPDACSQRLLEIAVAVTGAEGGSLMELDSRRRELRVRAARGLEPELWGKVRVRVGDGVAGRAAAEGRPILVRGRTDPTAFRTLRARPELACALCVPIAHDGRVCGVLNLHHGNRRDFFDESDVDFAKDLGARCGRIVGHAAELSSLRQRAARFDAAQELRAALAEPGPPVRRWGALCRALARRADTVAELWLADGEDGALRKVATSLPGGALGGGARLAPRQGLEGRAAHERTPVWLRDEGERLAGATLPLVADDRLVGVLALRSASDLGARETWQHVAALAGPEIDRIRSETRTRSEAMRAAAIDEAGFRILTTPDAERIARLAASSAAMVLGAEHAVVRLRDASRSRYPVRASAGSARGASRQALLVLDRRAAIAAMRQGAPVGPEELRTARDGGRDLLVVPILAGERPLGTIGVYDRIPGAEPEEEGFGPEDRRLLARLAAFVTPAAERVLAGELSSSVSEAELAVRIDAELARAAVTGSGLALVTCRVETPDEGRDAEGALREAETALRGVLRPFELLARRGERELAALLPDPRPSAGGRVAELARAVVERLSRPGGTGARPVLVFGYAEHPADGVGRAELLARAAEPRIRSL